ncbi:MAG: hypothetical protein FJY07_09260 [Bacteroidetes bacterium]|nr:hypothetical protein [Bacteroidota bacterium]
MKTIPQSTGRFLVILLLLIMPGYFLQSQNSVIRNQNAYWKVWAFNINSGITAFNGDLSIFDDNYYQKMVHESGPAAGLKLTRHLGRLLGITGQALVGKLHGGKRNTVFNSKLLEYNLHLTFNLYNLFVPDNRGNFGFNLQAGMGQFLFSSVKDTYLEGEVVQSSHGARVPEFVYFAGGGIFFRTKTNLGITLDVGIRQCDNDWLDVTVLNQDMDYYTYMSVGFTYYLQNIRIMPLADKARIAYNDRKLKNLRN